MSRLRIGFLIDNKHVDSHVYSLINEVKKDKFHFHAPLLISLTSNQPLSGNFGKILTLLKHKKKLFNFFRTSLSYFILKLEIKKLMKNPIYEEHGKQKGVDSLNLEIIKTEPIISKSGVVFRLQDKDIRSLKEYDIDLLIRCGGGILRGSILNCTKYGVLSFHHGDNRVNRGVPAGFWEVFNDEPSSGFVIQKLTEALDGGEVLFRGNIMTASYWQLNYANLCKKGNFFILKILKDLSDNNKLPLSESYIPYGNKLFRFPQTYQLIQYICKQLLRFINNKVLSFLNYRTTWSVSYLNHQSLNRPLYQAETIKNPHGRFLADPFLFAHEGRTICFVEDFFYDDNRGKISAYELTNEGHSEIGVILEEDFHLSFPYIFEFEENIYMCPETNEKNEIRLYKCNNFPDSWSFYKTIIRDVSAADSLIFPYKEKWYLLTNICSSQIGDHNSELHLYFSDSPISDEWEPYRKNPVIFDSQKARNGGLFTYRNEIFRVNQIHDKTHYGRAFGINKILEIDQDGYFEENIHKIFPNFYNNLNGTHHFSYNDSFLVFDHWKNMKS